MDPVTVDDIAGLATTGLADLSPQVLAIGGVGTGLTILLTVYGMVQLAIRSKGKRVG